MMGSLRARGGVKPRRKCDIAHYCARGNMWASPADGGRGWGVALTTQGMAQVRNWAATVTAAKSWWRCSVIRYLSHSIIFI